MTEWMRLLVAVGICASYLFNLWMYCPLNLKHTLPEDVCSSLGPRPSSARLALENEVQCFANSNREKSVDFRLFKICRWG